MIRWLPLECSGSLAKKNKQTNKKNTREEAGGSDQPQEGICGGAARPNVDGCFSMAHVLLVYLLWLSTQLEWWP